MKRRHIHIASVIIWVLSTVPIWFRIIAGVSAAEDGISGVCVESYFCIRSAVIALPIILVCFYIIPLIGSVMCNMTLLYYSFKMMRMETRFVLLLLLPVSTEFMNKWILFLNCKRIQNIHVLGTYNVQSVRSN